MNEKIKELFDLKPNKEDFIQTQEGLIDLTNCLELYIEKLQNFIVNGKQININR